MKHTVRLMNNRLMWIRLPDDSDWYRIAPDRGPWWTHDRKEAETRADALDWELTRRHYPSIVRTPPTAEDFRAVADRGAQAREHLKAISAEYGQELLRAPLAPLFEGMREHEAAWIAHLEGAGELPVLGPGT